MKWLFLLDRTEGIMNVYEYRHSDCTVASGAMVYARQIDKVQAFEVTSL
ncbi:MAG: hypothetical protein NTV43_12960 [Methylococcales bacterium]|nr:hypothetical protein [Methylococcales bacterium]